ncbi:hypothetical protein K3495_g1271 [Podosphaera aphanis]|nr:hypothetical protein K3495_g1271 [Podosphaera aphanis]
MSKSISAIAPNASSHAPRFTSQSETAEDLLSKQTEGLVALSDFRKRRAQVIEAKERDAQELLLSSCNGRNGTGRMALSDGATISNELLAVDDRRKKKKQKCGQVKLSFGEDDAEVAQNGDEKNQVTNGESDHHTIKLLPKESLTRKSKIGVNSNISLVPKALTKAALMREAQTREALRKEFLILQEAIKSTEIEIPFVFYDGTNIPGGTCRVKKGDFIWVFLDRSRKAGAELMVGEKAHSKREWARIGVDDLMLVRGSLIIPHHYDFYYFIINHTLGPNNRILFDYSSEPPKSGIPILNEPPSLENYNPLSRPSDRAKPKNNIGEMADLEGKGDDPTFTKVVDRRWYERNKHIFPASVWQEFDPEKNYQKEVKRDLGGNAFFFS